MAPTSRSQDITSLVESLQHVQGNVPQEYKDNIEVVFKTFSEGFARPISHRLKVTELEVHPKVEEPRKVEARVVFELEVAQDMVNGSGTLHGGCSAYLIDFCSSTAISLHCGHLGRWRQHVSSTMNVVYHAPAPLGVTLKIINTTMSVGARAMSVRTEIYDATNKRLVASGTHVKMEPGGGPKL